MLKTVNLPHGPWKTLLSGIWSGKEISYHENPEHELLVMIYDRRGEAIRGMVFFMVKLFSIEGKIGSFADALGENSVVIQKKTPTFKGSFLAVMTDPEYVRFAPRELISAAERHFDDMEKRAAEARKKSGDFPIKLVEERYADLDKTNELFGEPLALPSLVVRKEGPELTSKRPKGRVHLGITLDGKKIEEGIGSFLLTTVFGPDTRRALHVIMEGCLLNGVSGVAFGGFENAEVPNKDTEDYSKYGIDVEPLGMPTRRFRPGTDFFIELGLLNKELFGDITGAGQGKATELIGKALKEKPAKISQLIQRLTATKEEEDKYFAARGVRICKLLDLAYPGLFNGKLEPKEIVAPWLKKMGRIAIINTKGLRPSIKKGIVYATIKTLYESYKREFASDAMKVLIIVGEKDIYGKGKTVLDRETNALLKLIGDYGIGVCVNAEDAAEIDTEIMQNATMQIQTMEANNASVKEHTKRPYRIKLRPTLSAM